MAVSSQTTIEKALSIIRQTILQNSIGIILGQQVASQSGERTYDATGKLKLAIEQQSCKGHNVEAVTKYFKMLLEALEANTVEPIAVVHYFLSLTTQSGIFFPFGASATFGEGRQVSLSQLSIGSLPDGSGEEAVVENLWSRIQLRLRRSLQDELKRLFATEVSLESEKYDELHTHLFRSRAVSLLKLIHVFSKSPDDVTRLYLLLRQSQIELLLKQAIDQYTQTSPQANSLLNNEYLDRLLFSWQHVSAVLLRMVQNDVFLLANVFSDVLVVSDAIKFLGLVEFETALLNLSLDQFGDKVDAVYTLLHKTCTTQFLPRRSSVDNVARDVQYATDGSRWPRHTLSHFVRLFALLNASESRIAQLFSVVGLHSDAHASNSSQNGSSSQKLQPNGLPKSALRRSHDTTETDEYLDYTQVRGVGGLPPLPSGKSVRNNSPDAAYGSDSSLDGAQKATHRPKAWTRSFGRFLPALVSSINAELSQLALNADKLKTQYNAAVDCGVTVSCAQLRFAEDAKVRPTTSNAHLGVHACGQCHNGTQTGGGHLPSAFISGRMPQRVSPILMASLQQLTEFCAMLFTVNGEVQFRSVSAALVGGIADVLSRLADVLRDKCTSERDQDEPTFNYALLADVQALLSFSHYTLDTIDTSQTHDVPGEESKALDDLRVLARDLGDLDELAVERLIEKHMDVISDSLLFDSASFDFDDSKEFCENERCSYPIQAWNTYLQALRYDLWSMLCPAAATHVLAQVLDASLGVLERLYSKFKPSLRRIAQYRTDIIVMLACTEELLFSIADSPADLFELTSISAVSPDSDSDAILSIHNHCCALLTMLTVVTAPLDELGKVHRRGFYKRKVAKRDRDSRSRFDSLRHLVDCKPTMWLSAVRPHLFASCNLSTMQTEGAVFVLLRLLFDRSRNGTLSSFTSEPMYLTSLEQDLALLLRALTVKECAFAATLLQHSSLDRGEKSAGLKERAASGGFKLKLDKKSKKKDKEKDEQPATANWSDLESHTFACALFGLLSELCEGWNTQCVWQVMESVANANGCRQLLLDIASGEIVFKTEAKLPSWLNGFFSYVHKLFAPTICESLLQATAEVLNAQSPFLGEEKPSVNDAPTANVKRKISAKSSKPLGDSDRATTGTRELPATLKLSTLPCGCTLKPPRISASDLASDSRTGAVKKVVTAVLDLIPQLPTNFLDTCVALSKSKLANSSFASASGNGFVDVVLRVLLFALDMFKSTYSQLSNEQPAEVVFNGVRTVLHALTTSANESQYSLSSDDFRSVVTELQKKTILMSQLIRAQLCITAESTSPSKKDNDASELFDTNYDDEKSAACFYRSVCVMQDGCALVAIAEESRVIFRYMAANLGSLIRCLNVPGLLSTVEDNGAQRDQTLPEKVKQFHSEMQIDNSNFAQLQDNCWFTSAMQYSGFKPTVASGKIGWFVLNHAEIARFPLRWTDLCTRDLGVSEFAFRELLSHRPDLRSDDTTVAPKRSDGREAGKLPPKDSDTASITGEADSELSRQKTVEILQRRFNLGGMDSYR